MIKVMQMTQNYVKDKQLRNINNSKQVNKNNNKNKVIPMKTMEISKNST